MSIEGGTDFLPGLHVEAFDADPDPFALSGVLFEEDFGVDKSLSGPWSSGPLPEAVQPMPAALRPADLLDAREAGFSDGQAAARAEAETARRTAAANCLSAVAEALTRAHAAAEETARRFAQEAAETMLAVLVATLPQLCAQHGAAECAALAEAILPSLKREPKIEIRLHHDDLPAVHAMLATCKAARADQLSFAADNTLARGDCVIEWNEGEARRDSRRICRTLDELLATLGIKTADAPAAVAPTRMELHHG